MRWPPRGLLAFLATFVLCSCDVGFAGNPSPRPPDKNNPTAAPLSGPTNSSTTLSVQAPGGRCLTSSLAIIIRPDQGALGSSVARFEAKNSTATSCTVLGYFGLELLDAQRQQIGAVRRDIGMGWSFSQPQEVLLGPGESARFNLQWWGNYGSGGQYGPCTEATLVELTAPDQFDHVFIPARVASHEVAIRVCGNGELFLGPVSASSTLISLSAAQADAEHFGYDPYCMTEGFVPPARMRALICGHPGAVAGGGVRALFFTDTYLGTDAPTDSNAISFTSGSDTTITLSYRLYKASDPGCCPSLGTADVRFRLDATRLVAMDPIPTADYSKDGHR